jgi:predicted  nucleic acid-binding Zn-ribbon protein
MENIDLTSGVAGGAVVAFLTVLAKTVWPSIKEWLNWSDEKEKIRIAQAKEGPVMVGVRLELEVKSLTDKFDKLTAKYEAIQSQHHQCEVAMARQEAKHAAEINALKSQNAEQAEKILNLESQIAELKKQQGIWQKIETTARVAGDAKNAEQAK